MEAVMPQSLSLVIVQIVSRRIPGIVETIWGAVRRTIPMGLHYDAGLQPLMILVNLPPGALPQAAMKRAFGALEDDRSALAQMYKLQDPVVRDRSCTGTERRRGDTRVYWVFRSQFCGGLPFFGRRDTATAPTAARQIRTVNPAA